MEHWVDAGKPAGHVQPVGGLPNASQYPKGANPMLPKLARPWQVEIARRQQNRISYFKLLSPMVGIKIALLRLLSACHLLLRMCGEVANHLSQVACRIIHHVRTHNKVNGHLQRCPKNQLGR